MPDVCFELDQERLPDIRCRICRQEPVRCALARLRDALDEIAAYADDFPGSEPLLRVRDMAIEATEGLYGVVRR